MCSTKWGKLFVLYSSACTAHPQPVQRVCLSLYFTASACTVQPQPVLHTLSLYVVVCPSACTVHPQPILRVCLSLYCTYFIQSEVAQSSPKPVEKVTNFR